MPRRGPIRCSTRSPTRFAFIGFSLPTFFTGLLLILIFSASISDWLPFVYRADIDGDRLALVWEHFRQAIMPVMVLGLFQARLAGPATCAPRCSTSSASTTSRPPAPRASAKRKVIIKHVVRNAMIPVVTLVALQMPAVFGGAIVTEQIFRIPGIGSLLISVDPRQRHAGHHGGDLRIRLPRRHLQPHGRYPLWLA